MAVERKVSVIGLGYVGLPVAVAFSRLGEVIAFDINAGRIAALGNGDDATGEVSAKDLLAANLCLTTNAPDIAKADFHIVTVPTPIDGDNKPDLGPLMAASKTVGGALKKGDIVVYESTVYPGVTEDECVPVLESASGLKCGTDFTVGYSPERINPGDKEHRFETITKVVAGQDAATLETVAATYGAVVTAGVHKAPSIKAAEAAKVIENTQRDLNIALMNELSLIFGKMGIDTHDVLAAAGSKWNFLPFTPGLVGGHCIGVDPYYLTHKAEALGYHPQVILAGRRTNDAMGAHVANLVLDALAEAGTPAKGARVTVLGLTFKEDVPDLRNSKVVDVIHTLLSAGAEVRVVDPVCDGAEAKAEYGLEPVSATKAGDADAVVLAVSHKEFMAEGWKLVSGLLSDGGVVVDVKGVLLRDETPPGIKLIRL